MTFSEELDNDELHKLQQENAKLKKERDAYKSVNNAAEKEIEHLRKQIGISEYLQSSPIVAPKWAVPKRSSKPRGTALLMLSDLHLDEIVRPEEMQGVNAYNRDIALMRLKKTATQVPVLAKQFLSSYQYDGAVLILGGDIFSGLIHDELVELNEAPMLASLDYWLDPMAAVIDLLAEEFKKLLVVGVYGNHGRLTPQKRYKGAAQNNFDWFLYRQLERHYANDNRIRWNVPESPDAYFELYGHKHLVTHGNQANGGSGISGLLTPISLLDHRKRKRDSSIPTIGPSSHMWLGHFHQYLAMGQVTINGCFPAGTLVRTEMGMVPIETINEGDQVLSTNGDWEKVTGRFTKRSEAGLTGIKVGGIPKILWATPNHHIWAMKHETNQLPPKYRTNIGNADRPQWVPIDMLSEGDWVAVPTERAAKEAPCTPEEAWAYGLFLAEGHVLLDGGSSKNHHRIELTMHIREVPILERAKTVLDEVLGKSGRISTRPSRNTSSLTYSVPREVAAHWRQSFGHLAKGKRIPNWLQHCEPELAKQIVEGWICGDGHSAAQDDCRATVSATTISPELAYGMFELALRAGMNPSLSEIEPGGRRKNITYTIHFNSGQNVRTVDGVTFFRVNYRFRTDTNVEVYDLEVSGEHTYNAGLVGVHNSLKGYDDYAWAHNFPYEEPQQAFAVITPEHNVTWQTPIFASLGQKREGW